VGDDWKTKITNLPLVVDQGNGQTLCVKAPENERGRRTSDRCCNRLPVNCIVRPHLLLFTCGRMVAYQCAAELVAIRRLTEKDLSLTSINRYP